MNRSERNCLKFFWFAAYRNKTVVIKVGNWLTDFGGILATAGVIETARIVSKKICSVLNHVHRDRDKPPLLRSSKILAFKKNTESNKNIVNPDVYNKCHKLKVLTSKWFISLKSSDFVWKHTHTFIISMGPILESMGICNGQQIVYECGLHFLPLL